MRVVIFSTVLKEKDVPFVQQFFDVLHEEHCYAYIYKPYHEQLLANGITFQKDVAFFESHLDFKTQQFDAMIALGGDGTILQAVTHIRDSNVPIMGINLGRLGFLASIEKANIKAAIHSLVKGIYTIEERTLLYLDSNVPMFGDTRFALNDCTILKRDTSSMISIKAYVNGAYLNTYWADGIIIATPTGSTGYSLSCGGPIVFPNSGNFVITPVAPHNLNMRPLVVSDKSVLSFEIEGRADNFLCTLDSRFETISSDHKIAVRKCDFTTKIIALDGRNFLNTIQDKLAWGKDSRN
jgi:NAD+ kinase